MELDYDITASAFIHFQSTQRSIFDTPAIDHNRFYKQHTMIYSRTLPFRAARSFSTTAAKRQPLSLAYQAWESSVKPDDAESTTSPPIIFMHGLFGSKQNNRSMSKYKISPNLELCVKVQLFANDFSRYFQGACKPAENYCVPNCPFPTSCLPLWPFPPDSSLTPGSGS